MITWEKCCAPVDLSDSEIHVWKVWLDLAGRPIARHWRVLADEERARANRFHADVHRSRFIVRRAVLRRLLGTYLHIQPNLVEFEYGPHGKPALKPEQNPNRLTFNLSHANELALIAFSYGREIGIDGEFVRPLPDMDQIAAGSFSAREYEIWAALPAREKDLAFYLCWTRKEAFVKAIGNGFSFPLDQFQVTLIPDQLPRLVRVDPEPEMVDRWNYAALPEIPGFAAALISEGKDWQPTCFEYQC